MPTSTKALTARVAAPLAARIASVAAQHDRSNNWVVNQALELYLSIEEEHHQHTLKALSDAKAGRVIGHATIKSWAERLGKDVQGAPKPRKRR